MTELRFAFALEGRPLELIVAKLVAVVLLLFAEKDTRGLARAIFPFVLGLVFATVYVCAHYGVDALAGIVSGVLCAVVAERLVRREIEHDADP